MEQQRDAESTVTPDPKSWSKNELETGNREESYQVRCRKQQDVATVESKEAVNNTGSLHSSVVSEFHPCYSANEGSSVVAPLFNGSNVNVVNFNINQTSSGPVNHDAPSQPKHEKKIAECKRRLRETLKRTYSLSHEGMSTRNKTHLRSFYTELHIIKGGSGEVIKEHEVRELETDSRTDVTKEESIHLNQLFLSQREQDVNIRTVVTMGVIGSGKTVYTNKFILDWAEGRENTNLDFVFPVPFKDLNLLKKPLSLVELVTTLFPDTRDSELFTFGEPKILFILDGLDESRLSLDFNNCDIVSNVMQPAPVADLLINIIRRKLLESALVWITTRPESFEKIPPGLIDLVIEVRGFKNPQKDEYFRRKICDPGQADKVISHVKSCKSLYIMCHIPVFCWILVSDLEKKLSSLDGKDTPLSLTPMYIHFLTSCVSNMMRKPPFPEKPEPTPECVKADIISLGKLAFEGLNKDLSIFYESDLTQSGIRDTEPSMLSGIYTQIFSEELDPFQLDPFQEKTFSFVHLSVQEFFAALYVYLMFNDNNVNVLIENLSGAESDEEPELNFFKAAVEKALQCEKGHFDLFLRFLLGLSLESKQKRPKFLMTRSRTNPETRAEIIKHIKERIRDSPSLDRRLNLVHCLKELNDRSLVEQI